jgi:hypothetical protein
MLQPSSVPFKVGAVIILLKIAAGSAFLFISSVL